MNSNPLARPMSYPCARCTTGRYFIPMGCLCEQCDRETADMTQAELDADAERYGKRKKIRRARKAKADV